MIGDDNNLRIQGFVKCMTGCEKIVINNYGFSGNAEHKFNLILEKLEEIKMGINQDEVLAQLDGIKGLVQASNSVLATLKTSAETQDALVEALFELVKAADLSDASKAAILAKVDEIRVEAQDVQGVALTDLGAAIDKVGTDD